MFKKILSLLIIISIFSGCSLTEFQSTISESIESQIKESVDYNDKIEALPNAEIPEEFQETSETEENDTEEPKEEIKYIYDTMGEDLLKIELKNIGGTYSDFVQYINPFGEVQSNGIEGVYYTLNSVEIYDNYYEAELDDYGLLHNDEDVLTNNAFILVETTVKYIAPEGGKERIKRSIGLNPYYLEDKCREGIWDRININNVEPNINWFSNCPKKNDEELDYIHEKFCFMISDGEEITFKVGIMVGHDFVEDKNVFLRVGYLSNSISSAVHQYFVLIPDENNSKFSEAPETAKAGNKAYLVEREDNTEIEKVKIDAKEVEAVIYKIGDTVPEYMKYQYTESENVEVLGYEGSYIRVNSATVYDNFYEAGLDSSLLLPYLDMEYIENNKFVLVDVTAFYKAPEGDPSTLEKYSLIGPLYLQNKVSPGWFEKYIYDEAQPFIICYNVKPTEEYGSDMYFTIKDGEEYNYQIGIVAVEELIETNNLYIRVGMLHRDIVDYVYRLVELCPTE